MADETLGETVLRELREQRAAGFYGDLMRSAADEIERLRAELKRHAPVSHYDGRDIESWAQEARRLREEVEMRRTSELRRATAPACDACVMPEACRASGRCNAQPACDACVMPEACRASGRCNAQPASEGQDEPPPAWVVALIRNTFQDAQAGKVFGTENALSDESVETMRAFLERWDRPAHQPSAGQSNE